MQIRPIRNDDDHAAALREIEGLWDVPDGSPRQDRMEVLALLVEDYERKWHPMPRSSPLDILRYAVSDMGRSQAELAALLGSRSRASEILAGRRRISLEAAYKISTAWHIPAELLIQPYDLVA